MNDELQAVTVFYDAIEKIIADNTPLEEAVGASNDNSETTENLRLASVLHANWSGQQPSPAFRQRLRERLYEEMNNGDIATDDEDESQNQAIKTINWLRTAGTLFSLAAGLVVIVTAVTLFSSPFTLPWSTPIDPQVAVGPLPQPTTAAVALPALPAPMPPQVAAGLGALDGAGVAPPKEDPTDYKLATALPVFPDEANVYRLEEPDTSPENFIALARRLGFNDEQISEELAKTSQFRDEGDALAYPPEYQVERPGWLLHYYTLGNSFVLQTQEKGSKVITNPRQMYPKGVPESEEEAISIAREYLEKYDLLPDDCLGEPQATLINNTFPSDDGSGLVEMPDHWSVRFSRHIDGLPVTGFWHIGIEVWVESEGQVTRVASNGRTVAEPLPYPIKTAKEAWADLTTGKIVALTCEGDPMPTVEDLPENTSANEAMVTNVNLVYREWEVNLRQEYLQPLYAFSGMRTISNTGGSGPDIIHQPFTVYVAAVRDEYMAKVRKDGVGFEYQLQSALPEVPDQLEVYQLEEELVTKERVETMAATLGFGDVSVEPQIKGGETHYYIEGTPLGKTQLYRLNASDYYGISYGLSGKHIPSTESPQVAYEERVAIAEQFLDEVGLLADDITIIRDGESTMPVTFARSISEQPLFDPSGQVIPEINVYVMNDGLVSGMEYQYRKVVSSSTRATINPVEAWEKLRAGEARLFEVDKPRWMGYLESDNAVVQDVSIGYLRDSRLATTVEPVYLFQSVATLQNDVSLPFTAWVPAVHTGN